MAKFNPGDMVMIRSYTRANWSGPYEVIRMFRMKKSYRGAYGGTKVTDGRMTHVEYQRKPWHDTQTCNKCYGAKVITNESAGTFYECEFCNENGQIPAPMAIDDVPNRSDRVILESKYLETIVPAEQARKLREAREKQQKELRIQSHIATIVRIATMSENPEKEVAEYIEKWGYNWNSNYNELYLSASQYNRTLREQERNKVAV